MIQSANETDLKLWNVQMTGQGKDVHLLLRNINTMRSPRKMSAPPQRVSYMYNASCL